MPNVLFVAFATVSLLVSDAFELVRVSQAGDYKVAYSLVRVLGKDRKLLVETRTDRYGRITLDLPPGTYQAVTFDGKRTFHFKLTIDGSKTITRIELK